MNRQGDTSWIGALATRTLDLLQRFQHRQSSFSLVTALLPGLVVLTILADLAVAHPHTEDHRLLVIGCATLLAALALGIGQHLARWAGLLMLALMTFGAFFVTRGPYAHSEANVLLTTPVIALYLGWFYAPVLARGFGIACLLGYVLSVLTSGVVDERGFSPAIAVGYTVFIAGFCLEAASFLRRRFEHQAVLDPLTRVFNRRGLLDYGTPMILEAHRSLTPITLALVDFDDFKAVNDAGGHAAGDEALRAAARSWIEGLDEKDLVARIGGDEFVLLIMADRETADMRLRAIREEASHPWSWGLTQIRRGDELDDLMKRADRRMYRAKDDREG